MAQWTPVQANIGRGTASLMGVAQQGVSDIGKVAGQYLDRVAAEEREAQRQKERGEDVAFRQAQADAAKDQWQKGFDLQKAQADRAQTEFDRKLLSEQSLAEYNARLAGGLTRGEMSPQQAALVNAEVERLSAQGVTPDQMAGRLGKLLSFQAPKTAREKAQYIQQAGFDVLMGNTDRLSNPSNFVFAYNTESKETRLVNMDYGRCLQTIQWHDMAEANYQPEYLEEDLDDCVKNVFSRNDSIVSSSKINESIEILKEHGFEQFQIDLQQTFLDLDELKNQFEGTGFEKFATVKIETMKAVLQSEKIQELITDIGLHAEDFIGIESENNEINI